MTFTDARAPRPTGAPVRAVELTGKLFPWSQEQPVLLQMPGSSALYLPCFSSAKGLREVLGRSRVGFGSIKQIDDGREFLSSIPGAIVVIVDPRYTEQGRVRFTQVLRD